jgi:hypothetical protein
VCCVDSSFCCVCELGLLAVLPQAANVEKRYSSLRVAASCDDLLHSLFVKRHLGRACVLPRDICVDTGYFVSNLASVADVATVCMYA